MVTFPTTSLQVRTFAILDKAKSIDALYGLLGPEALGDVSMPDDMRVDIPVSKMTRKQENRDHSSGEHAS